MSVETEFKNALSRTSMPGSGPEGVLRDALVLLAKKIDEVNARLDKLEDKPPSGDSPITPRF